MGCGLDPSLSRSLLGVSLFSLLGLTSLLKGPALGSPALSPCPTPLGEVAEVPDKAFYRHLCAKGFRPSPSQVTVFGRASWPVRSWEGQVLVAEGQAWRSESLGFESCVSI